MRTVIWVVATSKSFVHLSQTSYRHLAYIPRRSISALLAPWTAFAGSPAKNGDGEGPGVELGLEPEMM